MAESLIDQIIRSQTWLEKVGDGLQSAIGGFHGALGRPGRALRDLLHGTTLLDHPKGARRPSVNRLSLLANATARSQ